MICRLTALDRRSSNRIIESYRDLTQAQTGLSGTLISVPVYAFGKWFILTQNRTTVGSFSQCTLVLYTSLNGVNWTAQQTLLSYTASPSTYGAWILMEDRVRFDDGLLIFAATSFGYRNSDVSYIDRANYVFTTQDGTTWNTFAAGSDPNFSIYNTVSAGTPTGGADSLVYGNGVLAFRNSNLAWVASTVANNFADPFLVTGADLSNSIPAYFNGWFYGIANVSTGGQMVRTQDFVTFEPVAFPAFGDRKFYRSDALPGNPEVSTTKNPNFLWAITVETENSQPRYYIWKTINGVDWDPINLPSSLNGLVVLNPDPAMQAENTIAFGYTGTVQTNGIGLVVNGALATTNFANFMDFSRTTVPRSGFWSTGVYPAFIKPQFGTTLRISP